MDSKITLRLSKSGEKIIKSKSYEIRINGKIFGHINNEQNTFTENLPTGEYSIEVVENGNITRREIVSEVGQIQTLTINPSLPYKYNRGFLLGVAIFAVCLIGFIAVKNKLFPQLLPLMFAPFIPFLLFKKRHYDENFALTISKENL